MKNVGEFLADRGIAVFAPDQRGFGHYSGTKGHVMSFEEYEEDLQNLVMQVKDTYLNKITYLFGSSMGGLNAIRYVLKYPRTVDGLLLQSPAVSHTLEMGIGKKFAGSILSALNVKRYVEGGVDYADTSRDPENVERLRKDPLRFTMVTPRFGMEVFKASKEAFQSASRIIRFVSIDPGAVGPTSAWKGCSEPGCHQPGTWKDVTSTPSEGIAPRTRGTTGSVRKRSP